MFPSSIAIKIYDYNHIYDIFRIQQSNHTLQISKTLSAELQFILERYVKSEGLSSDGQWKFGDRRRSAIDRGGRGPAEVVSLRNMETSFITDDQSNHNQSVNQSSHKWVWQEVV